MAASTPDFRVYTAFRKLWLADQYRYRNIYSRAHMLMMVFPLGSAAGCVAIAHSMEECFKQFELVVQEEARRMKLPFTLEKDDDSPLYFSGAFV